MRLMPPGRNVEVTLKPVDLAHARAMARWLADPEVKAGLGVRREITLGSTQRWIQTAQSDPSVACFAIYANAVHVGNVTIDQMDSSTSLGRFSIYIGASDGRGKGVATAATKLAIEHAFNVLHLRKLWLIVHVGNLRAVFSYLKAGFIVEGLLRKAFPIDSVPLDAYQMGLLSSEYRAG